MAIDLHIHSTFSDGTLSPEEIVREAGERGLRAISITDHDCVDGVQPAQEAGARYGVEVVPGVEINTDFGPREVHILGYFIRPEDAALREALGTIRESRRRRAAAMVQRLGALGVPLELEAVLGLAPQGSVGRPHVAQALVAAGACRTLAEAFTRYLKRGRPAYVPRYKLSPAEAIAAIRESGGLAALAHPGLIHDDRVVKSIIALGVSGLEIYHCDHTPAMVERYRRLAARVGLAMTGGSDSHGPGAVRPVAIGAVPVPDEFLERLRARHRQETVRP